MEQNKTNTKSIFVIAVLLLLALAAGAVFVLRGDGAPQTQTSDNQALVAQIEETQAELDRLRSELEALAQAGDEEKAEEIKQKIKNLNAKLAELSQQEASGQSVAVGPMGPAGSPGANGSDGSQGAAGPRGPRGAEGAEGPQGPQGPSGTASCPNGPCLSLQASSPGVQETGNINISGNGTFGQYLTVGTDQTTIDDVTSALTIVPQGGDLINGITIKAPSSTWGPREGEPGVDYGKGQVFEYLKAGTPGTAPDDSVLFRIDSSGGLGTAGGVHIATGLRQDPGYSTTQAVWVDPAIDTAGIIIHNPSVAESATWTSPYFGIFDTRNNQTVLWVAANNNIGVGTAAPTSRLDIRGSAASQIHLSNTGSDNGAYILGSGANSAFFMGGASYNGSSFVAKATVANVLTMFFGSLGFYSDTGLTVGNTYSPTLRFSVDSSGNLALGGHVITGNTPGGSTTVAPGGALTCSGGTPSSSISGNDTAGTVTLNTGTGPCSAGVMATVTFRSAYGSAPKVIFTPANGISSTLQYFNNSSNTTTFTLDTNNAPSGSTTYRFNYFVVQ